MGSLYRLLLGALLVLGGLAVLHLHVFAPKGREELVVGFLPVTCHLTCPVTNWVTTHSQSGATFRSKKYTDWSTVAEELQEGRLKASFLLAPLAMGLRRNGVPIKIVHLGHRDGTTLVVKKDGNIQHFPDLRGRTVAVPHMYSNQRILLSREIERHNMAASDLRIVAFPPPEMPAALQRGAIDAYIVGEPMAAKAELSGFGRVLAFTKDIWPGFISCVLVVHESLIRENRQLVQELVTGISRSGLWLDAPGEDLLAGVTLASGSGPGDAKAGPVVLPEGWDRSHRSQAAAIAAQKRYYNQDPELLRYVLTKPPDRVRYTDLRLAQKDFVAIQRYAEELGYFRPSTPADPFGFYDYCDPSFSAGSSP